MGHPKPALDCICLMGCSFAILCYRRRGDWRITSPLGICGLLVRSAHCCNRWLQNIIGLIQSEFISESHHSQFWTGGECVCGETSLSCIVVEDCGSFHLNLLPPVGCGHPPHSAGTRGEGQRGEKAHLLLTAVTHHISLARTASCNPSSTSICKVSGFSGKS